MAKSVYSSDGIATYMRWINKGIEMNGLLY